MFEKNLHQKIYQRWKDRRFKYLLVWLLLYIVVGPFVETTPFAEALLASLLTLALVSALLTMGDSRGVKILTGLVILPTIAALWLQAVQKNVSAGPDYSAGFLAVLLGIYVFSFGRHLLQIRRVNGNVICAALCLYLIFGMLWGALFNVLESIQPGSFGGRLLDTATSARETTGYLYYLSYVTLSTLGYGDIVPLTRGATALCQSEAIVGQFLTVVMVARLVGIQVAQESLDPKSGS